MNLKTLLYLFSTNKATHCYDVDHKPVGLSQDEWNRIIKSQKHACGFKKIPFKYLKNKDKQNVINIALVFVHNKNKVKEDAARMVKFMYDQKTRIMANGFLPVPKHIIKKKNYNNQTLS